MAELLYRIGRFAARRHWAVIGAWLAVLAVTVVTYLSFAGALSSNITLPDTLHVLFLRSMYAHARIHSIDVSEAANAPGVV